jgi:hypothetical protein
MTRTAAGVGPWEQVGDFSIDFADLGNPNEGRIYQNGLNQIRVRLVVTPQDGQSPPNDLNEGNTPGIRQRVLDALGLINFTGRQRLPFVRPGDAGVRWCYTDQPNDFVTSSSSDAASASNNLRKDESDSKIEAVFYVMCPSSENNPSISIAAQINVPLPGGNGTYSVDTAGGDGADQTTVRIVAIPPTRYTESNTSLSSQVAYTAQSNSPNRKMLARNYWLSNNEPEHEFVKFLVNDAQDFGDYWHVFDEGSAYQLEGESFKRYPKFKIAYIWNTTDQSENVFNLRTGPDSQPELWPVKVNQMNSPGDHPSAQYFTVVEYDATLGTGPGYGYPGPRINYANTNDGKDGVYLQVWDQYGNSGFFCPTTRSLLDEFKLRPGKD